MIKRHAEANGTVGLKETLLFGASCHFRSIVPLAMNTVPRIPARVAVQSKGPCGEQEHEPVSGRMATGFVPPLWFDSVPQACYIILWRGMQCNDACTGSCYTKTGFICSREMRRWPTMFQCSL